MDKLGHVQENLNPDLYDPRMTGILLTARLIGSDVPIGTEKAIATVIDTHHLPVLNEREVLTAISTHLGVSVFENLKSDPPPGENPEYDDAIGRINEALDVAEGYLNRFLSIQLPRQARAADGPRIRSRKDIVDLISKTTKYGERDRRGLEAHAAYCALISVALAVFELQKAEAHLLQGDMRSVEDFFTTSSEKNDQAPLLRKRYASSDDEPAIATLNGANGPYQVKVSMRDKKIDSQITKYLSRPEANVREALKDAIGIRLETDKAQIPDVIIAVLSYLEKNESRLGISNILVEDRNILAELGDAGLADFKSRIDREVEGGLEISFKESPKTGDNPISSQSFRVVKILCNLKIPDTDRERSVEIQIVETENKNERGLSSYPVYELKKKITVMTRLFGACSEKWLRARLQEISSTREYSQNIIDGLQDPHDKFLMSLPGKSGRYAATSVYSRWLMIPDLISDQAERNQLIHGLGFDSDPLLKIPEEK